MATAKSTLRMTFELTITVDEEEARALEALIGYGDDAFLKVFYRLGTHYMEPHEQGLRKFFATLREVVPSALSRMAEAQKAWRGEKKKEIG